MHHRPAPVVVRVSLGGGRSASWDQQREKRQRCEEIVMDPPTSEKEKNDQVVEHPISPASPPTSPGTGESLWSTTLQDGEGSCCRVCHGEAEETRPLFHPCRCDGSIKFVHQDCLQTWLKVSKQLRPKCELCGEHFHFRNIYSSPAGAGAATGSPPALSVLEFFHGVYTRASCSAVIVVETAIVIILWAVVMPLGTFWWVELTHCYLFDDDWLSLFSLQHFPNDLLHWLMYWWEGMWSAMIVLFACLGMLQVCPVPVDCILQRTLPQLTDLTPTAPHLTPSHPHRTSSPPSPHPHRRSPTTSSCRRQRNSAACCA